MAICKDISSQPIGVHPQNQPKKLKEGTLKATPFGKIIYCKNYNKIATVEIKFIKLHVSFHAFSYYASLEKLFHRLNRHTLASLVHASHSGVSSNFVCP